MTIVRSSLAFWLASGALLWVATGAFPAASLAADAAESVDAQRAMQFLSAVEPFLQRHCVACHGPKKREGELALDRLADPASRPATRDTWERVLQALVGELMPPPDRARPTAADRDAVIRAIELRLNQVDCDRPVDPGRVTIRRLNRQEYNRTIRDLLGVTFRPADDFPSDDVGHGFDNIGDVLTVSPLLVEKYLNAAERIAGDAVRTAASAHPVRIRRERRELERDGGAKLASGGVYAITSRGSVRGKFEAPRRGEYVVRVRAAGQPAGPELPRLRVDVDDKELRTFDVAAPRKSPADYATRFTLDAGPHRIAAAFVNDYYQPDAPNPEDRDRNLYVAYIELEGPVDSPAAQTAPNSAAGLVLVRPDDKTSLAAAARATLAPFIRRAFRRPVADEETARYARLVELAGERGDTFERGVEAAVAAVLVSPHFLFRGEPYSRGATSPADSAKSAAPPATTPLADFELASRLSYFLWSSMPDETLFQSAERGELGRSETLVAQTRRMLADPRAEALAVDFGGQWLNLRMLDEAAPDPRQFPGVDGELRGDFRRESELLFLEILRQDRPITEFLDADYTFVNERLARHYGVAGVAGNEFRRVALDGTRRIGVLTHASILTLTSNPARTSPVKRGKWILENILGTPPPEPPPDVPQLEVVQKARPGASLRQQLEIHRRDANCAVCHAQMDALGFGFENFDAVGRWRDRDGEHPVDAAGELPGGRKFAGPGELVRLLRGQRSQFARMLSGKLLTYALGRGLVPSDRCVVDRIARQLESADDRFSALATAIVLSEPFRLRRIEGVPAP